MTSTPSLDRRGLLRAGGVTALVGAAATVPTLSAPATAAPATTPSAALTTRNPLVEQRADPFITRPYRGTYFMTGSVPEYDRLVVGGAPTLDGLASARERTIWRRPTSGRMAGYVWAPELHRIDGRWYVYFAAGDGDDRFRIRMYVLESRADDPREDAWGAPRQVVTPLDTFSLDATTFAHRGRRYYVWAQNDPAVGSGTNLYIAEMSSPLAITGTPVRIATPTAAWETQGFRVNEGAAVIVRNGRVFMTFSASATDARYCMGLLTADARADLLDPASWTKSDQPVFSTNEQTGQYGPGHNSFTVAEDGRTDVLVHHARDYREIVGDPLFDPNRHTRVQQLHWNDDGTPSFGVPVGVGGPITRLAPLDAPGSYVRQDDFALRVDADVRELADTQLRVVPGFLGGPDVVALQAVGFPDRYVHAGGASVRIEPYADTDAYGRATGFVRERGLAGRGSSWRLAGREGYLSHASGRVVVVRRPRTRRAREAATFLER